MTAVGKEGLYTNECKLRSQISLKYALEVLSFEDNLTTKKNNQLAKKQVTVENRNGITMLKVPLLKFIYYIFLESEKISDEFNKNGAGKF